MTRLDKLLVQSGLYSRSDARALIRSGSVAVNGVTVDKPETKADESAVITVLGAQVNCAEYRYFMLDKPAGVLSATEDPGQPTVLDLLPRELRALGLSPVGRLDKDTTGLLLLTNDGDYAHRVISPKHGVVKTYIASTALPVTAEDVEAFREGPDPCRRHKVPAGAPGASGGQHVQGRGLGGEVPPGQAYAGQQGKERGDPAQGQNRAAGTGREPGSRRFQRASSI